MHRLAFRNLVDEPATPDTRRRLFRLRCADFLTAANKIRRQALPKGTRLHLTSRDILRGALFRGNPRALFDSLGATRLSGARDGFPVKSSGMKWERGEACAKTAAAPATVNGELAIDFGHWRLPGRPIAGGDP